MLEKISFETLYCDKQTKVFSFTYDLMYCWSYQVRDVVTYWLVPWTPG